MTKKKILKKQGKSSKDTHEIILKNQEALEIHDPFETLLDDQIIASAIWECLRDNDPEGIMEIINAHIEAVSRVELAKKAKVPRSTLYHSLKEKNPTIKTLAKLVHSFEKLHK